MFLLSQTKPDFDFLAKRCGTVDMQELKDRVAELLKTTDLNVKKRDFEHLLFNKSGSDKILKFSDFLENM
jgi:hypothetical protein